MTKEVLLGTANLGLTYGATNVGEFDPINSSRILKDSRILGIDGFDTAPDYGVAEELIGRELNGSDSQKIITKIPKLPEYTFDKVYMSLKKSMRKLRAKKIYGLLFHDPEIWRLKQISDITKKLFETELVQRIGFSSYDENSIYSGVKVVPEWNIFQVPENAVDRRLFNSNLLNELRDSGCDLHVRSIFMQGMLAQTDKKSIKVFPRIVNELEYFYKYIQERNISPIDLCMSYANAIPWSTGSIVAAASPIQLREILNFKSVEFDFEKVPKLQDEFLDPRKWQ